MAAVSPSSLLDAAEVYAMIDALGDVGGAIKGARPDSLAKLTESWASRSIIATRTAAAKR